MSEITLQINMSPGDVAYGELTVSALCRAHEGRVAARIAVVDCCRPQRTRTFDPDVRVPMEAFQRRAARIEEIAEELRGRGYLDEVQYLRPGDTATRLRHNRKYLGRLVRESHDHVGCALTSYYAGLDAGHTRYLLHYDADMLLYQAPGYDWAVDAVGLMGQAPGIVAATPRVSPPFTDDPARDAPSLREGLPRTPVTGGWLNAWFSTRCFLIDRERLTARLPLVRGRYLLETVVRRTMDRSYPPAPEMSLFRSLGPRGGRRLNLSSREAWLLHPTTKPPEYVALLPRIMAAVARGEIPTEQRGDTEVNLAAWQAFLGEATSGVAVAR